MRLDAGPLHVTVAVIRRARDDHDQDAFEEADDSTPWVAVGFTVGWSVRVDRRWAFPNYADAIQEALWDQSYADRRKMSGGELYGLYDLAWGDRPTFRELMPTIQAPRGPIRFVPPGGWVVDVAGLDPLFVEDPAPAVRTDPIMRERMNAWYENVTTGPSATPGPAVPAMPARTIQTPSGWRRWFRRNRG